MVQDISVAHLEDVSRCPGSAMVIQTVRIKKTSLRLAASQSSTLAIRRISSVQIIDVFLGGGIAITIMIVVMEVMKWDVCRGIVRNRSLDVITIIVFKARRGAMESFIARINRMRRIVIISVRRMSSNVPVHNFVFISKYIKLKVDFIKWTNQNLSKI